MSLLLEADTDNLQETLANIINKPEPSNLIAMNESSDLLSMNLAILQLKQKNQLRK